MPNPCIHCFTEGEFNGSVPEASRKIVVGVGPAFVLLGIEEAIADALYRAVMEHGWRARGLVGLTAEGTVALLHDLREPDATTMQAAALHLAKQPAADSVEALAWLKRLASLPDNRSESEGAHA